MQISLEQIKSLRELTGVSMQMCKKVLEETNGDEKKAIELLRKKGEAKAVERSERATSEGAVFSYVHTNGRIGVLVQLLCETDFVTRSDAFQALGKDLAMHIAALDPLCISTQEVPNELVEKERETWKSQLLEEKKPVAMHEKIMEGKEKKFREAISLLKQPFVKNPELSVDKIISDAVLKLGENIKIARFVRYSL